MEQTSLTWVDFYRKYGAVSKKSDFARFFKELGWVEELGSGVCNILKYCPIYSKGYYPVIPVIVEEEIFRVKVSYNVIAPDLSPNALNVLEFCQVARSNKEMMEYLGLKPIHKNLERYVKPLLNKGLLQLTVPEKVNRRFQKYLITEKGFLSRMIKMKLRYKGLSAFHFP